MRFLIRAAFIAGLVHGCLACAPAHPGFDPRPTPVQTRRVESRTILTSETQAVQARIETGTREGPFYVLRAADGAYCLLTQRAWGQAVVGEPATCGWTHPRR